MAVAHLTQVVIDWIWGYKQLWLTMEFISFHERRMENSLKKTKKQRVGKSPNGTQVTGPRHVVALKSETFELNSCNPFGQLCKTESWQTKHCFQTFKHSNIRCLGPKLVIKKSNIFFPPSNLFSKCGKLYDFSSLNLYLWLLGIDCLFSQTRFSSQRLI